MNITIWETIKPFLEILILWMVYYRIFVFFEGTRSLQVLTGIVYIIGAFLISQLMGFETLNWLLTKLFGLSILAILILFQQELRHGLARLGQQHLFTVGLEDNEIVDVIGRIANAVFKMSNARIGCIIAIERETKLKTYIESGLELDAKVSSEILTTIFTPPSPMHDGGVVIRADRILASACLFPLTENPTFSKIIGTRHRAALGLSEHTDAVIVLVSEETSHVSIALNGKFTRIETKEKLIESLKNILVKPNNKKKK